jgi:hypothetical protein
MGEAIAIGLKLLAWIWHHKAWALVILLSAGLLFQSWRVSSLTIERDGYHGQIASAKHEEAIWKASYTGAANALKDLRAQTDANDARAQRQQQIADQKVIDLLAARTAAESEAESYRADLERKANAPGATAASVGRAAIAGLR